MLTRNAIEEFMLSRGRLRPRTLKEYRKHLDLFERSFPDLPDTHQLIQSWLNNFNGVTPETVHARFRTIRALYKQLYLFHNIPNLMLQVRPPQLKRKAMRTFTDQELFRLFSLPLTAREAALLTILLDIGPRAGECVNLTWDDITSGFVTLRGKTGERIVPISETTYRRLAALSNGSIHVFLGQRGPLTYEGIYKIVRRLCRRAGISGRRSSPHTFRHTFGTAYAAAEGCDSKVLQDIMGHQDFKTTLRYIQNNPIRMAQNHLRCTPLKLLAVAAQGNLFSDESPLVKEAEEILARRGGNHETQKGYRNP